MTLLCSLVVSRLRQSRGLTVLPDAPKADCRTRTHKIADLRPRNGFHHPANCLNLLLSFKWLTTRVSWQQPETGKYVPQSAIIWQQCSQGISGDSDEISV